MKLRMTCKDFLPICDRLTSLEEKKPNDLNDLTDFFSVLISLYERITYLYTPETVKRIFHLHRHNQDAETTFCQKLRFL